MPPLVLTFDEPEWALSPYADPADAVIGPVAGDTNALTVSAAAGPYAGDATIFGYITPPAHEVGTQYVLKAEVSADAAVETTPLVVLLTAGGADYFLFAKHKSEVGAGRQLVDLGSFTPTEVADLIVFVGLFNALVHDPPDLTQGGWTVYQVEIGSGAPVVVVEDEMALDAEPIFVKLAERLFAIPGLVTASRRFELWGDVAKDEQPALFLVTGDRAPENRLGHPPTWLISAEVFLYVRLDDADTIPGTQINAFLKAIEEALEWRIADVVPGPVFAATGRVQTTLGGLVQYAWMADVVVVEGVGAQQGAVKVGIEMRAAALAPAA